MRLTVAICTWNRARELDRALASLAACERPPHDELEVLVVNNRGDRVARSERPVREPLWRP